MEFDNNTENVKTKRLHLFGEKVFRVEILHKSKTTATGGTVEYGYAKKSFDGFNIITDSGILSCFWKRW
jgi:hypothetical protein